MAHGQEREKEMVAYKENLRKARVRERSSISLSFLVASQSFSA